MRRALLAACLLAGCGPAGEPEITVFAASSLAEVLQALSPEFEREHGCRVSINLGGSSSLAQTLKRGVPADLFLSAGPEPVAELFQAGLAGPTRRLAGNELVLACRMDSKAEGPAALESARRIAIGDPASVPAGRYAREALERLGLWEKLQDRLVPSTNVRVALGHVESGSADLAIVYATDVTPRVRILHRFDDISVAYSAVILKASRRPDLARAFIERLRDGRLEKFGFTK